MRRFVARRIELAVPDAGAGRPLELTGAQDFCVAEIPPRVEYSLTKLGQTYPPLLERISQWSRSHMLSARRAAAEFEMAVKD